MINPVNHGKAPSSIATYKVEPYVVAADVYACGPHSGRGGWTWYTGSAGWMHRLIVEYFLGLKQENNQLKFIPCIPKEWESFKVHYRYKKTVYHISVIQKQNAGEITVSMDGINLPDKTIALEDNGSEHDVQIVCFQMQE
jgi:cellobiose phosphorylase